MTYYRDNNNKTHSSQLYRVSVKNCWKHPSLAEKCFKLFLHLHREISLSNGNDNFMQIFNFSVFLFLSCLKSSSSSSSAIDEWRKRGEHQEVFIRKEKKFSSKILQDLFLCANDRLEKFNFKFLFFTSFLFCNYFYLKLYHHLCITLLGGI